MSFEAQQITFLCIFGHFSNYEIASPLHVSIDIKIVFDTVSHVDLSLLEVYQPVFWDMQHFGYTVKKYVNITMSMRLFAHSS